MGRNLILTTVHRIQFPSIEPFFRSLSRTDFKGDVVVMGSGLNAESIRQIERCGAQVRPFRFPGRHVRNRAAGAWRLWQQVFRSRLSASWKEGLAHLTFHLFYRRHLLYLDFLRAHPDYDRIFTTDCRDVFFQDNPFDWGQGPGLHVFLEDQSMQLDRCQHHLRWILSQFGSETQKAMGSQTVSCAGTVFGDSVSVKSYLETMVYLAMNARSLREADGDQGLHNYFVRELAPEWMTIHANEEGPVLTVGPLKSSNLHFNSAGWVTNRNGDIPPVVHQYDRIPELSERLLGHLRDAALR